MAKFGRSFGMNALRAAAMSIIVVGLLLGAVLTGAAQTEDWLQPSIRIYSSPNEKVTVWIYKFDDALMWTSCETMHLNGSGPAYPDPRKKSPGSDQFWFDDGHCGTYDTLKFYFRTELSNGQIVDYFPSNVKVPWGATWRYQGRGTWECDGCFK